MEFILAFNPRVVKCCRSIHGQSQCVSNRSIALEIVMHSWHVSVKDSTVYEPGCKAITVAMCFAREGTEFVNWKQQGGRFLGEVQMLTCMCAQSRRQQQTSLLTAPIISMRLTSYCSSSTGQNEEDSTKPQAHNNNICCLRHQTVRLGVSQYSFKY